MIKVWKKKYKELATATKAAFPQCPSGPRREPVRGGYHNNRKLRIVGTKPRIISGSYNLRKNIFWSADFNPYT
jgi:hypothetical protein